MGYYINFAIPFIIIYIKKKKKIGVQSLNPISNYIYIMQIGLQPMIGIGDNLIYSNG